MVVGGRVWGWGEGGSKCKGPEVDVCLAHSRKRREAVWLQLRKQRGKSRR